MKILNNIKMTMIFIVALILAVISYGLLPLAVDILFEQNVLVGIFVGFVLVPLGIGLYLSGALSSLYLIVAGIFGKKKIWWILGILLVVAYVGAVIVAIK